MTLPTGAAACFVVTFRDDYSALSQSFAKPSSYFTRKIAVNFWATDTYRALEMKGDLISTLFYAGVKWKLTVFPSTEIVYAFWAESSMDELVNFDLFAFMRYVREKLLGFGGNDYAVSIRAGFRYYAGRSRILLRNFGLREEVRNSDVRLE